MNNTQILVLLVILAVACVAAAVGFSPARKKRQDSVHKTQSPQTKPEVVREVRERMPLPTKPQLPPVQLPPTMPNWNSGRREALRQNLRIKVTYDEAKIDRLIEIEGSELKRKGGPDATVGTSWKGRLSDGSGRIASEQMKTTWGQKGPPTPKSPAPIPLGGLRRLILGHASARKLRDSGRKLIFLRLGAYDIAFMQRIEGLEEA
jgi:hypothetical protein